MGVLVPCVGSSIFSQREVNELCSSDVKNISF